MLRWECPFKGGYNGPKKVFPLSIIKSCSIVTSLIRTFYAKKLPTRLATIIGNLLNFTNILFRHLNCFLCLLSVTKVYISILAPHTPHRDIECEPPTKNHQLVDCFMRGLLNPFVDRMFNPLD